MTVYNKLVRDRIPDIIRANGAEPVTRVLDEPEYRGALRTKLREEVEEYLADPSVEELADIMEIISALATLHDANLQELEGVREEKARARGRFEKRIFLIEVHPRESSP